MSRDPQRALATALRRLLRPLVRLLLRNRVPVASFVEHAKKVYVDVALEEFATPGRKPSLSRASLLTGLTRKEVSRLAKLDEDASLEESRASLERYNRAARVTSGWLRDREFSTREGAPKPLSPETSFAELVRRYSGDVPARAVLDELVRVGAVSRREDGDVQLETRGYVPAGSDADKLDILGADVAELIATIDHNIESAPEQSLFQRKVAYDNLPDSALEAVRTQAHASSQALLEAIDRAMAEHDRDTATAPAPREAGRNRASLGIYWHEEPIEGSTEGNDHD